MEGSVVRLVPILFNSANACTENVTTIPPDRHAALVGSKSSFHQTSTSIRKTHSHFSTHIIHTCTQTHEFPSARQRRMYTFWHASTDTHNGIHVKFKKEVQKLNVKNKSKNFLMEFKKRNLRKNLITVLSISLPPIWFHPVCQCTLQCLALWSLMEKF